MRILSKQRGSKDTIIINYMSRVMRKCVLCHMRTRSLISAFVVRCLDSVMSVVSVTKISNLLLASVAAQAGLCLTWSETPEDTFSHDDAYIYEIKNIKLPYSISRCSMGVCLQKLLYWYRKFPKYSDTQKFVEITLKFELCGSTAE